jgi:hypothetical protein
MKTVVLIIGTFVVVAALVGFFRSIWRSPISSKSDGGEGAIVGESVTGGGHGGGDAG